MKKLILVLFVIVSVMSFAANVTTTLTPHTAAVGDVIQFSIRIDGVNDRKIQYPFPEGSDFVLLKIDSSKIAQRELIFQYAIYDTGFYSLPAMPVIVQGATSETLMTEPLSVSIESIVPDTASSIRENKPNLEHPLRLSDIIKEAKPWLIAIGIILVLSGALWWWLRRRKRMADGMIVEEKPLLPPHEEAIRALLVLKEKRLPQRGLMKEFYLAYSEIIKRYLERRYAIPALEMTTYDLEREFEDPNFPAMLNNTLLPALREGDLVKFAKFIPRLETCDSVLELGFRVVDENKRARGTYFG